MADGTSRVRPAQRADATRVAELRFWHLAETARLEPRLRLAADARERLAQAVSAWTSQTDRVLVVAEGPGESGAPEVVGYATGVFAVWPPILRAQRVGEVTECFVIPPRRGQGLGRSLLEAVGTGLAALGAEVLRAPVPTRNEWARRAFASLGFEPNLRVLERTLGGR